MSSNQTQPSVAMVTDTCIALCKAMKLMSRQLISFSASYSKIPFQEQEGDIYKSLSDIMKDVRNIQYSLSGIANDMNIELENESPVFMPENIIITGKEYILLNNVFSEYTKIIQNTSEAFTLFSSPELYNTDGGKNGKRGEKNDN